MISDSAVGPLKFQFLGFPLSQVSVVLPSAKNVVNAFFCFVLSPIVAVTKTQLFGQILSKPGCESNSHDIYQPLCNIYILHAGQRFPTNNLYTCIYYNKHRAISTKQTYISKTEGVTDRIQHT